MIALALGALLVALLAHEVWVARRQRRWREHHEARMAAMAERRAQAALRPRGGHVMHLGSNGRGRRQ